MAQDQEIITYVGCSHEVRVLIARKSGRTQVFPVFPVLHGPQSKKQAPDEDSRVA